MSDATRQEPDEQGRQLDISDRTLLLALLNVVGSLSHKLTGEWPMVCVGGGGTITHFTLGLDDVAWFKNPANARCSIHTERWFREHLEKKLREEREGNAVSSAKNPSPC